MMFIDNTVLSNFALADELGLLKDYCHGRGGITAHILAEFEQGVRQGIFIDVEVNWLNMIDLKTPEETSLFVHLITRLGAGEASCLAIAIHRKCDLLSDDMAVRKIALREGIRLSGSIGILLELIREERISLATGNNVLKKFIACGYFSPVDKLDDFL